MKLATRKNKKSKKCINLLLLLLLLPLHNFLKWFFSCILLTQVSTKRFNSFHVGNEVNIASMSSSFTIRAIPVTKMNPDSLPFAKPTCTNLSHHVAAEGTVTAKLINEKSIFCTPVRINRKELHLGYIVKI